MEVKAVRVGWGSKGHPLTAIPLLPWESNSSLSSRLPYLPLFKPTVVPGVSSYPLFALRAYRGLFGSLGPMECAHDIFKVWLVLSFCPPPALQADLWVRTLDGSPQEGSFDKRPPAQAVGPFPGEAACSLCLFVVACVCYPHSEARLDCIQDGPGRGRVDGGDILLASFPSTLYTKPSGGGGWG